MKIVSSKVYWWELLQFSIVSGYWLNYVEVSRSKMAETIHHLIWPSQKAFLRWSPVLGNQLHLGILPWVDDKIINQTILVVVKQSWGVGDYPEDSLWDCGELENWFTSWNNLYLHDQMTHESWDYLEVSKPGSFKTKSGGVQ